MIEFIKSLLNYLKTAKASPDLISAEKLVGPRQLRLISMNIVDWLKLENKRAVSKPLKLNTDYPWVNNLCSLIDTNQMFKAFFTINDKQELNVSDSVDLSEREEVFRIADEGYNPPRMT